MSSSRDQGNHKECCDRVRCIDIELQHGIKRKGARAHTVGPDQQTLGVECQYAASRRF